LTAIAKLDDWEIAQYDFSGNLMNTSPSLPDRWQGQVVLSDCEFRV
jgi:hypothetical protein